MKLSNTASAMLLAINAAPNARDAILAACAPEVRAEIEAEERRLAPLSDAEHAELAALNAAQAQCVYAASSSSRKSWLSVVLVSGVEPVIDGAKFERVFSGSLSFENLASVTFAGGVGCVLGAQDAEIRARIVKRGTVEASQSVLASARAEAYTAVKADAKAAKAAPAKTPAKAGPSAAAVALALASKRAEIAAARAAAIAEFEAASR